MIGEPAQKPENTTTHVGRATIGRPAEPTSATPNFMFMDSHGLRSGWRIFFYLGMAVIIFFLLSSFQHLIPTRNSGRLWQDLYIQAVLAVASIVPALIMAAIEKRSFGDYGLPLRSTFGKLFWIGSLWGILGLSALMLLIRVAGGFEPGNLAIHGARIARFAIFWGIYFLLVGFFEEFTFRGYSLFTLTSGVGFWPAAVALSAIFGALHLLNVGEAWIGALAAALIGLFFCFTVRRSGSLWFAVGMHTAWDWGESFVYSVPDSGSMVPGHLLNSSFHGSNWLTGGSVGPEGSVFLFLVIAAIWLLFAHIYRASPNHAGTDALVRPPQPSHQE
jgi:membrane protease YdiL (CAAX protease family)